MNGSRANSPDRWSAVGSKRLKRATGEHQRSQRCGNEVGSYSQGRVLLCFETQAE